MIREAELSSVYIVSSNPSATHRVSHPETPSKVPACNMLLSPAEGQRSLQGPSKIEGVEGQPVCRWQSFVLRKTKGGISTCEDVAALT